MAAVTVQEFEAALGRVLDAIPRSKKALVFSEASLVEITGKKWLMVEKAYRSGGMEEARKVLTELTGE